VRSTASSSTTWFAEAKRAARYLLVGAAAACVDVSLFLLLAQAAGVPYLRAAATSFVIATLVNYFLSVRFVFVSGVRFRRRWEVALVFAVSGVGLAVNQLVLAFGVENLALPLLAAKLCATGVVFFWNYGARRLLVFGPTRA
jgi:putative flippase GtrA